MQSGYIADHIARSGRAILTDGIVMIVIALFVTGFIIYPNFARADQLFLLIVCAPTALFALLGIRSVWQFFRRRSNPAKHPTMKKLARFGDPFQLAASIDAEMQMTAPTVDVGGAIVTPSWLLIPKRYVIDPYRLSDLVWMYQKVTEHRRNGVRVGTSYAVIIHDRHGKSLQLSRNGKDHKNLIGPVVERAPWVISGYSAELQKAWANERAQVIAAVDERRQKLAHLEQAHRRGKALEQAAAELRAFLK
jgi:hypothetical protein